jgi:hypothetical protein
VKDRVLAAPSARGRSVQEDWHAWLTEAKEAVFHRYEQQLESNYAMFSISLNEAIGLREEGHLGSALDTLGLSPGLCRLLTQPLSGFLRALGEHAKHYGTMPNAAPLNPSNFRGPKGQRSARMNALLNRILLSHRLQFVHKINALQEMVGDLEADFCLAASYLAGGRASDPRATWDSIDMHHYDINTCFREAIVLFKSFLIVVPEDQLISFQNSVREQSQPQEVPVPIRRTVIEHRRMTPIAGE